ncbi:MAG: ATP-binding protein [Clostridia bacterium]
MKIIEILGGLKDDEYLKDGVPFCKNCNTLRCFVSPDGSFAQRCLCECQAEKRERDIEAEEAEQSASEFKNRQKFSLLGSRYLNASFETADVTKNVHDGYEKCKAYAKNSRKMLEHNIGMYLCGSPSSGKTHLAACLCNELVKQGHYCVYTNLSGILNEIKATFGKGNELKECDLLKKLAKFEFVFIDDLGKEFLGREYNSSSAKWAEKTLFEILNARYNEQLPTVFTSNYTIAELSSILALDEAIIERISEMSTRVIRLDGDDFRAKSRSDKSEIAKELGI